MVFRLTPSEVSPYLTQVFFSAESELSSEVFNQAE